MQQLIRWSGNAAAVLGILCCAVAVLARLGGTYIIMGGPEVGSLFGLGVGLMVFACLAKIELLMQRDKG